jgi:hypothetical protein
MPRSEEFRIAPSGPIAFSILGALILVFTGYLAALGTQAHWANAVAVTALSLFGAGGASLIWIAIRQWRFRLVVDEVGVHFPSKGRSIAWGQIAALTSTTFGLGHRMLDRNGETLEVIPGQVVDYQRALLLISVGMEQRGGHPVVTRFEGSHGWLGLLGLVAGVAFLFREFDPRGLTRIQAIPAVIAAGFLALMLSKVVRLWRGTGGYELVVDREGIRFQGRSVAWEHRWGELKRIEATLEPGRGKPIGVRLITADDAVKQIPLRGLELHGVLQALRTFGGPAAQDLIPPAERPELPLLKRSF